MSLLVSATPEGQRSPILGGLVATLRGHAVILRNSVAMSVGTAGASVLGVAYWWVAARSFAAGEVGTGAALIAVMGLLGLFGEVGLGTLLLEAPRAGRRGGGLIAAALLLAGGASAFLASLALVVGLAWPRLVPGLDADANTLLVLLGTALTGMTLAADQALIGRLAGEIQLVRNFSNSVVKLGTLAAGAWALGGGAGTRVLLASWVIGQVVSLALAGLLAARRGIAIWAKPEFGLLMPMLRRGAEHHALNMAAQAPTIVFPFLVAVLFSPEVNAAFYPAWAVVHALTLFPAALTTVLYRVGTEEPERLRERLVFTFRLSVAFSLVSGAGLFFLSREILAFFNPAYPDLVGSGLTMLGFGVVSLTVRQHYLAIMRLRGRMRGASAQYALWSCVEVGAACLGAFIGGLEGFVLGWLVAITAQAVTMWPTLRAAMHPVESGSGVVGRQVNVRS